MTEILYGLRDAQRERIAALREAGGFFWLDVSLGETTSDEVAETLDIPERMSQALMRDEWAHGAARRFHADARCIVFATSCYVEDAGEAAETRHLKPVDVRVAITGEYLLTLHEERLSLIERLATDIAEGRSEQYVVYSVLDAMLATAFEELNEIDMALSALASSAAGMRGGRVRMAALQGMTAELARLRRRAGSQRGAFERIGLEIELLPGLQADDKPYFERLAGESDRLLGAIDSTADGMATVADLRLNEMSYLLTAVATVFLPLTFLTGFFGMNFDWMVAQIDTQLAFWLLGVGTSLVAALIAWRNVLRRSPVE